MAIYFEKKGADVSNWEILTDDDNQGQQTLAEETNPKRKIMREHGLSEKNIETIRHAISVGLDTDRLSDGTVVSVLLPDDYEFKEDHFLVCLKRQDGLTCQDVNCHEKAECWSTLPSGFQTYYCKEHASRVFNAPSGEIQ